MVRAATLGKSREPSITTSHGRLDLLKGLLLGYATLGAFFIAQNSRAILPERNFNDDSTIRDFIDYREVGSGPTPYSTTAWLFRSLGLGESVALVSFLAVLLFSVAVALALRRVQVGRRTWSIVGVAIAITILGALYLGKYSKEFFILPIIILLLLAGRKYGQEALWLTAAVLYAIFVRQYWGIIVGIYIVLRLLLRHEPSFRRVLVYWVAGIAALVAIFNVGLGVSANYYRYSTNEGLQSDRSTVIVDLISSSSAPLQFLNLVLVLATLLVPVPLLFAGSAMHVASAALIGAIWMGVLRSAKSRFSPGEAGGSQNQHFLFDRCFAFLVAYVSVQALFEPDYGSYLRHLVPVLPLVLVVLGRARMGETFE